MLLRLVRYLLLVVALLAIAPAAASAACADTVIDDYLDDGRVDGDYSQACYDAALNSLDDDLREYTNAEQDIRTAKQRARAKQAPSQPSSQSPPPPPTPQPQGGSAAPDRPVADDAPERDDAAAPSEDGGNAPGGGGAGGDDPDDGDVSAAGADEESALDDPATTDERIVDTGGVLGVETEVAQSENATSDGPLQQALRDVGPTGGNDLPVPVLVLGGLAILLIAVGAGGIVLRRLQSRE